MSSLPYDALLLVSFGGPERREDVIPFLENVLRGKPVPRERLLEVAEHYYHFDGISPINGQCRELLAALREELDSVGISLPLYWGNRNWNPLLTDTVQQMTNDGVRRALAIFTSAYSSYSGCRQYQENLTAARTAVGEAAPEIDRLRMFYNHPLFIAANADRIATAIMDLPSERRDNSRILFTAHSIPMSMAGNCNYVRQLEETCRLITDALAWPEERWSLVYQSRSGRPQDPWLEPDILDVIQEISGQPHRGLVIAPIGFLSDHMEVLYDLDDEARKACDSAGISMVRAGTVGTHPQFVTMLRQLIEERLGLRQTRTAIGEYPASHDVCPADCCRYTIPQRPESPRP